MRVGGWLWFLVCTVPTYPCHWCRAGIAVNDDDLLLKVWHGYHRDIVDTVVTVEAGESVKPRVRRRASTEDVET
jgi:hypothetical protein